MPGPVKGRHVTTEGCERHARYSVGREVATGPGAVDAEIQLRAF